MREENKWVKLIWLHLFVIILYYRYISLFKFYIYLNKMLFFINLRCSDSICSIENHLVLVSHRWKTECTLIHWSTYRSIRAIIRQLLSLRLLTIDLWLIYDNYMMVFTSTKVFLTGRLVKALYDLYIFALTFGNWEISTTIDVLF